MSPWKPMRRILGKCMFTYKNVQSVSFSVMSDSLWPHGLMDCSLPDSSAHGIFQESTLEWVAIPFSRGSSWPRDWTLALQFIELVSCIASRVFTLWASREAQECSNHHTLELISQANKVMLKIPQVMLQQYMNQELPDVPVGFRNSRGTRDQIAKSAGSEKKREFQKKNIYFCFTDYTKAFDLCGSQHTWKILKEMEIPGHLTCLLRILYAGQEAIVRTGHGTMDWFKIWKEVRQDCILSPCLLNLYAEYIMRNAGLEESQIRIKIVWRNINNLWYADDTIIMGEAKRN